MANKNILMIVAQQGFRDEEYEVPRKIFREKGFEVVVAASEKGIATGKLGTQTTVDLAIDNIEISDFQAMVLIGGPGVTGYFQSEKVWNLVREAEKQDKVIAAICIAPTILANAGVLQGKKATAFPSEEQNLVQKGAQFSGNSVEVDGNIITASGPEAAREFGEKIVSLLERQ